MVASYGLIAGIGYSEMLAHGITPGMVCDFYLLRQRYDDNQHGIRRKKEDAGKAGIE